MVGSRRLTSVFSLPWVAWESFSLQFWHILSSLSAKIDCLLGDFTPTPNNCILSSADSIALLLCCDSCEEKSCADSVLLRCVAHFVCCDLAPILYDLCQWCIQLSVFVVRAQLLEHTRPAHTWWPSEESLLRKIKTHLCGA